MIHVLKLQPPYFDDVASGKKTFEVRWNDRNFAVGDFLDLREWQADGGTEDGGFFTNRSTVVRVQYLLDDFAGIKPGWVVMGVGE